MSETVLLFIVAGAWTVIGVILAAVMGRRGHHPFTWFLIGAILGPIAIVLAITADHDLRRRHVEERSEDHPHWGPVDVMVGIDGSPESVAAVDEVRHLFGERIGRLYLATVLPYDSPEMDRVDALARLETISSTRPKAMGLKVLTGMPAEALSRSAAESAFDLLAVGTRGSGLARLALGSTAEALARSSKVPVLLVTAGATVAA